MICSISYAAYHPQDNLYVKFLRFMKKKHCTDIWYDTFMQKCMQKKPSLNNRYARVLSPYKCEQILLEGRTLFPLPGPLD